MPQTGPKSHRGKAVSNRNSSKHGILSDAPVVVEIGEDYNEWERHRVGTIESLGAEGHIEIVLAERIANLLWRLKRLERYETEMISRGSIAFQTLCLPSPQPARRWWAFRSSKLSRLMPSTLRWPVASSPTTTQ
ncbi:MAG TPA: hypothetical protein VIP09_00605 [Dehalococcoidia bacterium]|jgi:hypothetical protein